MAHSPLIPHGHLLVNGCLSARWCSRGILLGRWPGSLTKDPPLSIHRIVGPRRKDKQKHLDWQTKDAWTL